MERGMRGGWRLTGAFYVMGVDCDSDHCLMQLDCIKRTSVVNTPHAGIYPTSTNECT